MPWNEFCTLLSGIMPDTPLGQIVQIRAEADPKVIKSFNSDQKKIYNDWKNKIAKEKENNAKNLEDELKQLEKMFETLFKEKGV